MKKTAKAIRIITAPPLLALALFTLMFSVRRDIFPLRAYIIGVLLIAVLPTFAYVFKRERESQRRLAFVLSGVGYAAAFALGCALHLEGGTMFVFLSYLMSATVLTLFNKVLRIRASGHACAVAGPATLAYCIFGIKAFLICLPVYVASFWASLYSKRHTASQLIFGTLSGVGATLASWLIYVK